MALIKCPECSREISDKAGDCPQCAFPISSYLEKMKAEKLEQETIRAEKIKQKELLKQENFRKRLNENKDHIENNSTSQSDAPFNSKPNYTYTIIVGAIGFLILFFIYIAYSNNKITEAKHQQEIKQKRFSFNKAKSLINNNSLSRNDLEKAITSLASVDASMPEYKEAQRLLNDIIDRINKEEYAKTLKAEKEAEDAKYTPGGRRIHAKHPEWDAIDCNAIAKGHIGIGMTKEQVAAAWGRPYKVNKSQYASGGIHEQWVINEMGSTYVYFEDGICTAIQN